MTTRTISPELKSAMKQLRLGKLLDTLPDRLALSEKDEMPRDEFLLMLLTDEISRRQSTATTRRAEEVGLHTDMVLERWDKTVKVTLDRRLLQELCSLRFLQAHRNVAVLGPVGVGKTFVANTLDLLIVDDFALEPMSRDESRDVYQLLVERNARAATIVTSNRDTAEWLAVFGDTMLAQSAVDRFKNNAYDFVIEGESYRSRLKPKVENDGPPPSAPAVKRLPVKRKRRAIG